MVYACICLCWGSTIRGNDHCLPRGTTMFWASLPSRNKPLVGGALDLRISGISMYPELRGPPGLTGRSPWLFSLLCATPPSAWLLLPLNVSAKVVQAQMKCRALLRREHSGDNGIYPSYQRTEVIAIWTKRYTADSLAPSLSMYLLFTRSKLSPMCAFFKRGNMITSASGLIPQLASHSFVKLDFLITPFKTLCNLTPVHHSCSSAPLWTRSHRISHRVFHIPWAFVAGDLSSSCSFSLAFFASICSGASFHVMNTADVCPTPKSGLFTIVPPKSSLSEGAMERVRFFGWGLGSGRELLPRQVVMLWSRALWHFFSRKATGLSGAQEWNRRRVSAMEPLITVIECNQLWPGGRTCFGEVLSGRVFHNMWHLRVWWGSASVRRFFPDDISETVLHWINCRMSLLSAVGT